MRGVPCLRPRCGPLSRMLERHSAASHDPYVQSRTRSSAHHICGCPPEVTSIKTLVRLVNPTVSSAAIFFKAQLRWEAHDRMVKVRDETVTSRCSSLSHDRPVMLKSQLPCVAAHPARRLEKSKRKQCLAWRVPTPIWAVSSAPSAEGEYSNRNLPEDAL